jgi:hypothetical protein
MKMKKKEKKKENALCSVTCVQLIEFVFSDDSTRCFCDDAIGQKSIIFQIYNGGYTIEVEIHGRPYNVIKNCNYTGLVDALHNGHGKCCTKRSECSIPNCGID